MTTFLAVLMLLNLLVPVVKVIAAKTKNKTDDAAVALAEKLVPVVLEALKHQDKGLAPAK